MRNIGLVFDFEFKGIVRKKTFIITTIILCLIAFAVILIPSFLVKNSQIDQIYYQESLSSSEAGGSPELVVEQHISDLFKDAGYYLSEDAKASLEDYTLLATFKNSYADQEALHKAIRSDEINFGVAFESNTQFELFIDGANSNEAFQVITQSLTDYNKMMTLLNHNIDPNLIEEVYQVEAIGSTTDIQARHSGNIVLGMAYTFIMYMLIIMYGSTVSTSVAREKDNRTMELLISNTKPDSLIIGKSLAAGLAGILQMLLLIISVFVAINVVDENITDLLEIVRIDVDLTNILVMIFFAITGYLFYLFIYAGLGAMVSKIEDVNYAITPITLLFATGYVIVFSGINSPNSLLYRVFSMVPFTSVLVMPVRSLLVFVPTWEIILSVAILFVSIILFSYLAIRIYRLGSLSYGNRMKILPTMRLIIRGEDK